LLFAKIANLSWKNQSTLFIFVIAMERRPAQRQNEWENQQARVLIRPRSNTERRAKRIAPQNDNGMANESTVQQRMKSGGEPRAVQTLREF
jgi:hypothetical protein